MPRPATPSCSRPLAPTCPLDPAKQLQAATASPQTRRRLGPASSTRAHERRQNPRCPREQPGAPSPRPDAPGSGLQRRAVASPGTRDPQTSGRLPKAQARPKPARGNSRNSWAHALPTGACPPQARGRGQRGRGARGPVGCPPRSAQHSFQQPHDRVGLSYFFLVRKFRDIKKLDQTLC